MPRLPIIFSATENKVDAELGGAVPLVVNALADGTGTLRRRPGVSTWNPWNTSYTSGSAVVAMCAFGTGRLVYVTADRKLHAVTTGGGNTELSSTTVTTQLDGGLRPVLVPGRNMLVAAGGGAMQKWTGTGLATRLTNTGEGGDPPAAGSACAIAQRLVAQLIGDSGQLWWTGPLEQWENWDMATGGASYIQAAAKPDPLVAVRDNGNEIFAWGSQTTQVFAPSGISADPNDPNNVLDFQPARTQDVGTCSPDSIVSMGDKGFALLDRNRRFVLSDARTFATISRPIEPLLTTLTNVADCWGFRMLFGRFDAAVWFFPTDNVGLIWDAATNRWAELREGDTGTATLAITSAYFWPEESVFLVGRSDGSIARLDPVAWTDLGASISVDLQSGFSNRGTAAIKACLGVTFQFRRTYAELAATSPALSPSGFVRISYRDKEGAWKVLRDIKLSDGREPHVSVRSLGNYRTRQWRVQYTGQDELQLVSAEEELEVLEAA